MNPDHVYESPTSPYDEHRIRALEAMMGIQVTRVPFVERPPHPISIREVKVLQMANEIPICDRKRVLGRIAEML